MRRRAVQVDGLPQQPGRRVGLRQVGRQQVAAPAQALDLGLQRACLVFGMAVMRQHVPAGAGKVQADLAPQPARGAGDQHGTGGRRGGQGGRGHGAALSGKTPGRPAAPAMAHNAGRVFDS